MKEVSVVFPGVNTALITLRNQAQHIQDQYVQDAWEQAESYWEA